MSIYFTKYIFNYHRTGWAEIWYQSQANIQDAWETGIIVGNTRVLGLGYGASLEAMTVSDIAVLGDSLVTEAGQFPDPPVRLNAAQAIKSFAKVPWDALLCLVEVGGSYRRHVWLRSAPDDFAVSTIEKGQIVDDTVFGPFQSAYQTALRDNQFRLRVISKDPLVTVPKPVDLVTVDGGTGNYVYNVVGHALTVGMRVKIAGVKGTDIRTANGVGFVTAVPTGGSFLLDRRPPLTVTPHYLSGGTVYRQQYDYQVVTSFVGERWVKKSTGRAFFVPRGRR